MSDGVTQTYLRKRKHVIGSDNQVVPTLPTAVDGELNETIVDIVSSKSNTSAKDSNVSKSPLVTKSFLRSIAAKNLSPKAVGKTPNTVSERASSVELGPLKKKQKSNDSQEPKETPLKDKKNAKGSQEPKKAPLKDKKDAKGSQEPKKAPKDNKKGKGSQEPKKAPLKVNKKAKDSEEPKKAPLKDKKKAKVSQQPKKAPSRMGSQFTSIVYRTTPGAFSEAMSALNLSQKKVIRELGFGSLIGFNIPKLHAKLVYYVVDAFNDIDMVIRTSKGDIKCDEQAVFDVFGIKKGTVDMYSGTYQADPDFYNEWLRQFPDPDNIRLDTIAQAIVRSKGATDFFFKMNFIMLFWNTMIFSDSSGLVKFDVLDYVSRETKVCDIDWCGHLLRSLEFSKNRWNRNFPTRRPYCGPAIFLTLLYLDRTKCESVSVSRQRPVFKHWSKFIKVRASVEMALGQFGLLELAPDFVEEKDLGEDVHVSEPNDEAISEEKKEYLKLIEENLDVVYDMKILLVDTFKDVAVKFGYDEIFRGLRSKMIDIFSLKKGFDGGSDDDDDELVSLLREEGVDCGVAGGIKKVVDDVMGSGDQIVDDVPGDLDKEVHDEGALNKEVDDFTDLGAGGVNLGSDDVFDKEEINNEALGNETVDKGKEKVDEDVPDDALCDGEELYDVATDDEENVFSQWFQDTVNEDLEPILNAPATDGGDTLALNAPATDGRILNAAATDGGDTVAPCSPMVLQPVFGKRRRRPAAVLQSPFVHLETPVSSRICHSELCVAMQMFSELDHDRLQMVFEAPSVFGSTFGLRYMFYSLAPGSCIESGVIDCWAAVLNFEERSRKRSAVSRLFLNTSILSDEFFAEKKKKSWKDLFELYEANLRAFFNDHADGMSLRDFDMVFFPLCRSEHFYLLVYDLRKKPSFHIIDNIIPDDDGQFNGKYKKVVSAVHKLFSMHLIKVNHPSAQLVKGLKPTQMNIPWNTKDNFVDCGVFLMRHMECFKGQSANSWKCGLPTESTKQKLMLLKLRVRYTAKILTHDINKHAAKMLLDAGNFSRRYTLSEITELFRATRQERKSKISQS